MIKDRRDDFEMNLLSPDFELSVRRPVLEEGKVHLWRLFLNRGDAEVQSLERLLSVEERARAESFIFRKDRSAYIVSHAFLRTVLAGYLDAAPEEITFGRGSQGKPHLAGLFRKSGLFFNLSHSGEIALMAVTRLGEIGVDIERIRPRPDDMLVADQFLSAGEKAQFLALPQAGREAYFFSCWTRKEACLKATGRGLVSGPANFEISSDPENPGEFLEIRCPGGTDLGWVVRDIYPACGYAAAVAAEGRDWKLRCCNFPIA